MLLESLSLSQSPSEEASQLEPIEMERGPEVEIIRDFFEGANLKGCFLSCSLYPISLWGGIRGHESFLGTERRRRPMAFYGFPWGGDEAETSEIPSIGRRWYLSRFLVRVFGGLRQGGEALRHLVLSDNRGDQTK